MPLNKAERNFFEHVAKTTRPDWALTDLARRWMGPWWAFTDVVRRRLTILRSDLKWTFRPQGRAWWVLALLVIVVPFLIGTR